MKYFVLYLDHDKRWHVQDGFNDLESANQYRQTIAPWRLPIITTLVEGIPNQAPIPTLRAARK
jgi:hypothetical protein